MQPWRYADGQEWGRTGSHWAKFAAIVKGKAIGRRCQKIAAYVETRTIAQLGLLFGSTWQVSGVTIAAILAMIIGANLLVERTGALPARPLYAALVAALVANYLVPASTALGGGALAAAGMAAFCVLPLFFAALIFAGAVRGRANLAPALASNLVGSVLGGLLENLSLATGIAGLSLGAVLLYAASYRR